MSETVWILLTVTAWIVVMGAISVFADIVKQSDHARRSMVDDGRADEASRRRHPVGTRAN